MLSVSFLCINAAFTSFWFSRKNFNISLSQRKRTRWVEKAFEGANGLKYGKSENANATIRSTHLPRYLKGPRCFSSENHNYPFDRRQMDDLWKSIRDGLHLFNRETSTAKKHEPCYEFNFFFGAGICFATSLNYTVGLHKCITH